MDISIDDQHKPQLARLQHVLEWLHSERQRLQVELAAVTRAGAQHEAQVAALLQQAYGVDAQHVAYTLDTERGVIIVPDAAPTPAETED